MFSRLWNKPEQTNANAPVQNSEEKPVLNQPPVGDVETLESRVMLSAVLHSKSHTTPAGAVTVAAATAKKKTATTFSVTPVVHAAPAPAATTTAVTSDASDTPTFGDKITLTAAVTGASPTGVVTFFDGATKLGTGTSDGSGNWTYAASSLAAGAHSITAVYGGDSGNATSTSSKLTLTLAKAATTLTWADPADIVYGTPLSTTQLNATSGGVSGAFVYSSPASTILKAGSAQAITVTFTPASANFAASTATAHINVTAKALTVTGITANNKVYTSSTDATLVTKSSTFVGLVTTDKANVTLDTSGVTAAFAGADVGKGLGVTVTGLALGGSAAANYTLTQPSGLTATITAAPIIVSGIVATDKVYDGTSTATVDASSATLTGVQGSDDITLDLSSLTATFAKPNAGSKVIISTSGLALTGDTAADYQVFNPNLLGNITAKPLTIAGVVPLNKIYDGTTTATLGTAGAALVGVVSADKQNVTLVTAKAAGTFSQAGVGSGLAVTIAGLTISGTAATNYTITQPTGTARIFSKNLTITGVTAANKTYSGSTTATIDASKAALVGVVTVDKSNATLDTGNAAGTFLTPNVGTAIPVAVSGLGLKGSAAGNYTLTQPSATANITAKALTVTGVTAADKTYDGTTDAVLDGSSAALSGVVNSDDVTLDGSGAVGTFASKNAASGVAVAVTGLALSGSTAGNYTLTQPATTATITTRTVSISGVTASDKVYDGTTTATLDFTGADISGVIAADASTALTTKNATGAFADANVASGITVTVSGLALSGAAAANYTVTQPTTPANITAKALTVTGVTAADKTYDGTTDATLDTSKGALVGVVKGDESKVSLDASGVAGAFADANAAVGKNVTITGLALSGDLAANYSLTAPSATAKINAATVTVGGIVSADKVYDGTTVATLDATSAAMTGVLDGDSSSVTLDTSKLAGAFSAATVASGATVKISGLALTGSAAANYALTAPTTTAGITAKTLTVSGITAASKVYDGTTAAVLSTKTAALVGFVPADKATVTLDASKAAGAFGDSDAAKGLTVTISGVTISGAAASNYHLTQPTATADITAAPVTVTGAVAADKTYDGAKTATIDASSAVLAGVITADKDAVTLDSSKVAGAFASAGVGTKLPVAISGLSLTGDAASNYIVTQPATTAKITAKALTVTGLSGTTKTYDGTAVAALSGSATLVGVVDADKSTISIVSGKATGTFASANVADGIAVTVAGLTLSGTAAANYTLTQPSTTAGITAKALTVTGITATDKVYDATTTATLVTKLATLGGFVPADKANVTLDVSKAAGAYDAANVGSKLNVTISGAALTGSAAGNYTLTQPTTTAGITAAPLTVTGVVVADKVYDGTKSATVDVTGISITGVIDADGQNVLYDASNAAGTFAAANAGTGIKVALSGVVLSGSAAGNYALVPPALTAKITPKAVTVTGVTVSDKVYDGTATGTLVAGNAAISGVIDADKSAVSLVASKGTATIASANVGSKQDVTIAGLTVSGTAAANYTVTQPTVKATITAKPLTVTGVAVANKVYNATTAATVDASKAVLAGFVPADKSNVTLGIGSVAGTFASANVGTKLAVAISGLSLTGSAAGNYTVAQPSAIANITAAPLTVTGVTAADRTYNGKLTATLDVSKAALAGVPDADKSISLSTKAAAGTFASKNAGTGIKVAVTGLTLTGATASNYTLTQPGATAAITAKQVTVNNVGAAAKVYDGTTAATLNFAGAHIAGLLASDAAGVGLVTKSATGTFASANAGKGISVTIAGVTLSGAAATNYSFSQPTASSSIKAKALTITGVTVADKKYDATTDGTVDASKGVLVGVVTADKSNVSVDASKAAGKFGTPNVGTAIPVGISGLALSGSAAANYTLAQPAATAKITPVALTVGGITVADKAYDGTTLATIDTTSAALTGVLDADTSNVTLDASQAVGTFAAAAKGNGVSVSITGLALTGSNAMDYTLTAPTATASIT